MSRFAVAAMVSTFILAGCGKSDGEKSFLQERDLFSFSNYSDKFTANVISEAVYTAAGSPDDSVEMKITLKCEVPNNQEPDPFAHTKIEFLLSDKDGNGVKLNKFAVKFDASDAENDLLKDINSSEYNNERIYYYAYMGAFMIPDQVRRTFAVAQMQNPFGGFVVNMFSGQKNNVKDVDYEISKLVNSANKMMIRYAGENNIENTSEIDISGESYRKVLSICGWPDLSKRLEEEKYINKRLAGETGSQISEAALASIDQAASDERAQISAPNGLCTSQETTLFQCFIDRRKKWLALCQNRNDVRSINYKFGIPESLDIELPRSGGKRPYILETEDGPRPDLWQREIVFTNEGVRYYVGSLQLNNYVTVESGQKQSTLHCSPESEMGSVQEAADKLQELGFQVVKQ